MSTLMSSFFSVGSGKKEIFVLPGAESEDVSQCRAGMSLNNGKRRPEHGTTFADR